MEFEDIKNTPVEQENVNQSAIEYPEKEDGQNMDSGSEFEDTDLNSKKSVKSFSLGFWFICAVMLLALAELIKVLFYFFG